MKSAKIIIDDIFFTSKKILHLKLFSEENIQSINILSARHDTYFATPRVWHGGLHMVPIETYLDGAQFDPTT